MAVLQDLDNAQSDQAIAEAVDRHTPATVTVRQDQAWRNLHSRLLAVRGDRLLIEMPGDQGASGPYEFAAAERIGVSFKLKHYKHLFSATVAGMEAMSLTYGVEMPVLSVCLPRKMQRLQRRAFNRVDVPRGRVVRASFWLGGQDNEPAGGDVRRHVWTGRVENISAGGLQTRVECEDFAPLEEGDALGVRLSFGAGADQTVFADAQFRHVQTEGGAVLVGVQFVGLAQTAAGRDALQLISRKVAEYQRFEMVPVHQQQDA